jgi:hypothetical protein
LADRLVHELKNIAITQQEFATEAEARLDFLSAVYKRLKAEALDSE